MRQLLIDGHNLIGQMPDLSLADLDDEEKLVALLRKYAARRRARIVVVFDSGMAGHSGGRSQTLSGGGVEAVFAGSHTDADRVLIERMRELKRPREWALVSSDRAIQAAAERHRVSVVEAAEFAKMLAPPKPAEKPPDEDRDDKPDREDNISQWLRLFKRK
ncbi:MAG TPA: NYN domain-containing protein [Anaerolineae bacterium]|nr:NYN domain-containing protein [Anaerolineae bacterium]